MTPLTVAAIQAMVAVCNPPPVVTWERVVAHARIESGYIPTAIHDNTTKRSHFPATIPEAVALATQLRAAGHSFDTGLGQVWSGNWDWLGLTPAKAINPQSNVCASTIILAQAYSDIERRVSCAYAGPANCKAGYAERIEQMKAELARGQWGTAPPPASPTPATPAPLPGPTLSSQIITFGRR